MRKFMAAVAIFGFACGGGEADSSASSTPATPSQPAAAQPAEAPAAPATGTLHEVRMQLTASGSYVFSPVNLTIKAGDSVRWINESGPPHNVAFKASEIPTGAGDFLTQTFASDAQKIGPMSGRLMTQLGDTYEINFAGAPTGTYGYTCTPHEALGMAGILTIEE